MADEVRRSGRGGVETSVRTAAVWESVRAVVVEREQQLGRPLRVIDLGGGTGGLAVPLAQLGHHVTVIDPSLDALASLHRRAGDSGVGELVVALQGDAANLLEVHPDADADLVCCHGALEFVDDPAASLRSIAAVLADGGYVSLVVATRIAAVLARALAGQFAQAQCALTSDDGRWGPADPLPRRFDAAGVTALVEGAGLVVQDVHGVRIFSDLVPAAYVDFDADRAALLSLEQTASRHPDYAFLGQIGAALHVLARHD
ncbi:MAG TPA: methyltransferase domain-containing protein [Dermatophilaceae bacterium]|nr:methyltransferase domain-containing protein [Dermatophilaceae bacterium]